MIAYWRWRLAFAVLPAVVLLGGLAWVLPMGCPAWLWAVSPCRDRCSIVALVVLPPIRYRVFWFAVSPTEIDIQHGIIFVKRTVVPLERVQSLRTERGPIADHYGMANLHIRTAGGSVSISGLRRYEADELVHADQSAHRARRQHLIAASSVQPTIGNLADTSQRGSHLPVVPRRRLHPIYLLITTANTVCQAIPYLVLTVLGGAPAWVTIVLFVVDHDRRGRPVVHAQVLGRRRRAAGRVRHRQPHGPLGADHPDHRPHRVPQLRAATGRTSGA